MYPMMDTTGWNVLFIALWGFHIFSVVAFFTGVLFLIVLAIKTFTSRQLKSWAIWLMAIGTIVCLITIALIGRPWIGLHYWGSGMNGMQMQQMNRMMQMMTQHDQGGPSEDHDEIEGMMRDMLDDAGNRPGMMQ